MLFLCASLIAFYLDIVFTTFLFPSFVLIISAFSFVILVRYPFYVHYNIICKEAFLLNRASSSLHGAKSQTTIIICAHSAGGWLQRKSFSFLWENENIVELTVCLARLRTMHPLEDRVIGISSIRHVETECLNYSVNCLTEGHD